MPTEPGTVEVSRKCLLNKWLMIQPGQRRATIQNGGLPQGWPGRKQPLPHLPLTCPQIQTREKGEGSDLERKACFCEGNKDFCCGQGREWSKGEPPALQLPKLRATSPPGRQPGLRKLIYFWLLAHRRGLQRVEKPSSVPVSYFINSLWALF